MKKDTKSTNIMCTAHTKVFRYIVSYGGKYLKRILTYLCCTKLYLKFYLILFMLESVHNLCEGHDLSFLLSLQSKFSNLFSNHNTDFISHSSSSVRDYLHYMCFRHFVIVWWKLCTLIGRFVSKTVPQSHAQIHKKRQRRRKTHNVNTP